MNKDFGTRPRFSLNREALTLPELLVAAAVLAIAITGILVSYLRCMELNEISKNMSQAVKAASSRMEQMRNTAASSFASVKTNYDQVAFDIAGLDGKGVSYVNDNNADLLLLNVCVSWKQRNGRVFGQDANLDGAVQSGEDPDGNGMLDSPVQVTTYFFKRTP